MKVKQYDVFLEEVLNESNHSVVVMGRNRRNGRSVAVKIIDSRSSFVEDVENEISLMEKAKKNKYSIKLKDCFKDSHGLVYIVTDYIKTQLIDLINELNGLPEATTKRIFTQLVSFMRFLHSKNIIHGDLKVDNIVLKTGKIGEITGNNISIRVLDFGFAKRFTHNSQRSRSFRGTRGYMAPEVVINRETRTSFEPFKAEIYSLGVVLYAILFGKLPFEDHSGAPYYENVNFAGSREDLCIPKFTIDKKNTTIVADLLEQMLDLNPQKRPTINEVSRHRWFRTSEI